ncbi:MAG: ATP-binding protein [Chitinophaga sp.]|uniref:AAA family ATPase n=1 Tax=Chitinophaga sp. TaxID=1869181 RepID=UPI0025C5AA44|nr:ATP-binding protein [Chitinophaga sp.]MBV8252362.1 ATP-binding protein [Chitinophaga sp.]
MLIEFSASNYRSIGDEQILSLVPNSAHDDYLENIIQSSGHSVLNAAAIYGNNGSGKSNLISAIGIMDKMVHISARTSSTTNLPYDPFLLREGYADKPTKFEIIFVTGGYRYKYGFEYFQKFIYKEWLYKKGKGREVLLFGREEDIIEPTSALKGNKTVLDAAIEATRSNGLFLSTCDMLNVKEAKTIMHWFKQLNCLNGIDTEAQEIRTVKMFDDKAMREAINNYMLNLHLGMIDLNVSTKDFDESDLPDNLHESQRRLLIDKLKNAQGYSVMTMHRKYDIDGKETDETLSWKLDEHESEGTIKAFHLSGPIISALSAGGVLVIDEIEAKMHPIITLSTINLFLNKKTNPLGAQIIFATHDTNLLTYSHLRRDQIFFTEKNKWESTELYSLSGIVYPENNQKERMDTNKEKRYLEGRYGAIPYLGTLSVLINHVVDGKKRDN